MPATPILNKRCVGYPWTYFRKANTCQVGDSLLLSHKWRSLSSGSLPRGKFLASPGLARNRPWGFGLQRYSGGKWRPEVAAILFLGDRNATRLAAVHPGALRYSSVSGREGAVHETGKAGPTGVAWLEQVKPSPWPLPSPGWRGRRGRNRRVCPSPLPTRRCRGT